MAKQRQNTGTDQSHYLVGSGSVVPNRAQTITNAQLEELSLRLGTIEDAMETEQDTTDQGKSKPYVLNSAAHPTHIAQIQTSMKPAKQKRLTKIADGTKITITHEGPIQILTNPKPIHIPMAVHSPEISANLISVKDLCTKVAFRRHPDGLP